MTHGIYVPGMQIPKYHNSYNLPDIYGVKGRIVVYSDGKAKLDIRIDNTDHTYELVPVVDLKHSNKSSI